MSPMSLCNAVFVGWLLGFKHFFIMTLSSKYMVCFAHNVIHAFLGHCITQNCTIKSTRFGGEIELGAH